jgi:hypothetical protein
MKTEVIGVYPFFKNIDYFSKDDFQRCTILDRVPRGVLNTNTIGGYYFPPSSPYPSLSSFLLCNE